MKQRILPATLCNADLLRKGDCSLITRQNIKYRGIYTARSFIICNLHQVVLDLPTQVNYMGETYSMHTGMRNVFVVCCENLNLWDCLKNLSVEGIIVRH